MKCYSCKREEVQGQHLYDVGEGGYIWMCDRCVERMEIVEKKGEEI